MHGADWNAIRTKYKRFLPDLTCESDLYKVIQYMLSELGVGHSYLSSGERFNNSEEDRRRLAWSRLCNFLKPL